MNLKSAVAISLSGALIFFTSLSASGAVKTYSSCSTFNKVYSSGVALSKNSKNVGGTLAKAPKISSAIYNANKKLDLDKDGIVCEVLKKVVASPKPTPPPTVIAEPTISLDNLDPKWVRIYGARAVGQALKQSETAIPNLTINYQVSGTVPSKGEIQAKNHITDASKLLAKLFSGQSVNINLFTELEDRNTTQGGPFTCGGRAWADGLRANICLPTGGNFDGKNPGGPFHEFVHLAQYTQNARTSNFFMEGTATYLSAVAGWAFDGVSNNELDNWLTAGAHRWKTTYESLGYKYTVEDMAKFLDVADRELTFNIQMTYLNASFMLGGAMWEAMIAVYGWDKFMSFFDSLDNGKTYAQNFEAEYGISLSDAHVKIAKYILSINWR